MIKSEKVCNVGKKILYSDFVDQLLLFNLKIRKKYLAPFFNSFVEIDSKRQGIITLTEFEELLDKKEIFGSDEKAKEKIKDFIKDCDLFSTGLITFSECVLRLDTYEMVDESGKTVKLLERF